MAVNCFMNALHVVSIFNIKMPSIATHAGNPLNRCLSRGSQRNAPASRAAIKYGSAFLPKVITLSTAGTMGLEWLQITAALGTKIVIEFYWDATVWTHDNYLLIG